MEFHALGYGFDSLCPFFSNDPQQTSQGHFFRSRLFPPDGTNEIIEIKLEIIDIVAGLAETWVISFSFVNGAIKES
jgi:hypothetical protein